MDIIDIIAHGHIRSNTSHVDAIFFDGTLTSVTALELFTKTKTPETYAVSVGSAGIMYNTTHLELKTPGDPEHHRDVMLFPGVYLVRCADGGYFTMPAAAFHEVYGSQIEGKESGEDV